MSRQCRDLAYAGIYAGTMLIKSTLSSGFPPINLKIVTGVVFRVQWKSSSEALALLVQFEMVYYYDGDDKNDIKCFE